MKKKNYNPFKMWGSWFGGLILILVILLSNEYLLKYSTNPILNLFPKTCPIYDVGINLGNNMMGEFQSNFCNLEILIYLFVIGFLLGWLIQSLWRKFK